MAARTVDKTYLKMPYSLEPLVLIQKHITQRFIIKSSIGSDQLTTRVKTKTPLYTASDSRLLFKILKKLYYTSVKDKYENFDQDTYITCRSKL